MEYVMLKQLWPKEEAIKYPQNGFHFISATATFNWKQS